MYDTLMIRSVKKVSTRAYNSKAAVLPDWNFAGKIKKGRFPLEIIINLYKLYDCCRIANNFGGICDLGDLNSGVLGEYEYFGELNNKIAFKFRSLYSNFEEMCTF